MNDTEARLRLAACRPGGQDADDPKMREALNELSRSPTLNAWFEEQQAFDQTMGAQVRGIPVPNRLQAEIIAAAKLSRPKPLWTRPHWLSAAAALVVAGAVLILLLPRQGQPTVAEYRHDVVTMVADIKERGLAFDEKGADLTRLNAFLAARQAPAAAALQGRFDAQTSPLGCRIVGWHGQKVSMICFRKGDDEAHLFVVDRASIKDADAPQPAQQTRIDGYPVASWTDADRAYVLVGNSPQTDLARFLEPG